MGLFANPEVMKEQIRKNMTKPVYKVQDYYKPTGFWSAIARNMWFEQITLVVIGLNAVWIGVDTEYNDKPVLLESNPEFIIAENAFCAYFVGEWLIRFMAFQRKVWAMKDAWFVFDTALVAMMIGETWIMMLITAFVSGPSANMGMDPSTLRLIRLLRLSRMARMARIFRAIPELMIMMKGLVAGIRPVSVTLSILTLVIYVFGVLFTQMTRGTAIGARYFNGVADSMGTLLLYGVFLEEIPEVFNAVGSESWFFALVLLFFILVGSFLVVNLLVGVLVETVRVVSMIEQEQITVANVKEKVRTMLDLDTESDYESKISKVQFLALLQNPNAIRSLQDLSVDVVGLVDLGSRVFEGKQEIEFPAFMDLVLNLRGSNKATVKDVVYLLHFIREEFGHIKNIMEEYQGSGGGFDSLPRETRVRESGYRQNAGQLLTNLQQPT